MKIVVYYCTNCTGSVALLVVFFTIFLYTIILNYLISLYSHMCLFKCFSFFCFEKRYKNKLALPTQPCTAQTPDVAYLHIWVYLSVWFNKPLKTHVWSPPLSCAVTGKWCVNNTLKPITFLLYIWQATLNWDKINGHIGRLGNKWH